jgi:pyrimidine-nucleoside phosphorylase
MIGQTPEIVPADRKLYALRDVTATVESPFLICTSIMSKKLAEGIDGLVLDVKTGSGAFMQKEEDAALLAELMVETGERMGKRVVALITDMNQPLGTHVGNSLEVIEALEVLRGDGPNDLRELSLELAGWMFYLGNLVSEPTLGKSLADELIRSGKALEQFRQMIELQGGNPGVIDDPGLLPRAQYTTEVISPRSGTIAKMDCRAIGVASVVLGGGRTKKEDAIDPAVGIVVYRKIGDTVVAGEPLCTIHYNSEARAAEAERLLTNSFQISGSEPVTRPPLVYRVIGAPATAGVSSLEPNLRRSI